MTGASTHDLVERGRALLEPGEVELAGLNLHTPYSSEQEIEMFEATLEAGELLARCVGADYEAVADQAALVDEVIAAGFGVTGVAPP